MRGGGGDFRGMRLSNAIHQSTMDLDVQLCRKGKGQVGQTVPHGTCADQEP